MMLRAIIIDDEARGRLALRQKLFDYCKDVELLGEAAGGEDGLKLIDKFEPDIIFLDIEMPRMDGFEMLKQVHTKKFQVVFTTAYDHYAIKAIKFAALDYLLKPVDIDELKAVVERATALKDAAQTTKKLEVLAHNLQAKHPFNKIAISTTEGLLFFNIDEIVHLEAQSNYTVIYFTGKPRLTASRTLKDFEELLPAETFFRPHHSHIINLNFIKRYIKGDGGQIELQNGNFVDVARRKKEEFLKIIGYA